MRTKASVRAAQSCRRAGAALLATWGLHEVGAGGHPAVTRYYLARRTAPQTVPNGGKGTEGLRTANDHQQQRPERYSCAPGRHKCEMCQTGDPLDNSQQGEAIPVLDAPPAMHDGSYGKRRGPAVRGCNTEQGLRLHNWSLTGSGRGRGGLAPSRPHRCPRTPQRACAGQGGT